MPNFKAQIRVKNKDEDRDKVINIKIRISHKHKTRYIKTAYYLHPYQFDNKSGKVIGRYHTNASFLNIELANIINGYERKMIELGPKVHYMSINNLGSYLKETGSGITFKEFGDSIVKRLKENDKVQYALSIEQTINKVDSFCSRVPFSFDIIDKFWLDDFENHCRKEGNGVNTIALHMRNIRKLYNDAIDKNYARLDLYPFRKYKIKSEGTRHRTLDDDLLAFIFTCQPVKNNERIAVDMFRLSFYLVGMNYKDILFATAGDMNHGRLNYIRNKTKRAYNIKIEPEALKIIRRYKGRKYLLCFIERKIKRTLKKNRTTIPYRDMVSNYSKLLKRLVRENKYDDSISSYYARHTWATIAHKIGIEKDVIRMALGHGQRTVTDIYINYDIEKIDVANRMVIDYVNSLSVNI